MKKLGFILLAAVLLMGCRDDVEMRTQLELSLCMPATNFQSTHQRVVGDPGLTEHFDLPLYAYIFVLMDKEGELEIWQQFTMPLSPSEWTMTHYNGTWDSPGDSIYRYNESLHIALDGKTPHGKVYAICSNTELTFNDDISDVRTEAEVLNLKYNTASDEIQKNLHNIYSTPYNYNVDGKYYCSYEAHGNFSIVVDLLMYHVASKVDLKWSVADSSRINRQDPTQAVRLTYLEARRLFNDWSYAFKPTENVLSTLPGDGEGYDRPNLVNNDEGLWWEGRTYFYTIPYTVDGHSNYFPLQLLMCTNGDTKEHGYSLTINQAVSSGSPFVPWMRGNIILTKPLTERSETMNITEN